jgi:hypothetical protein
MSNGKVYPDNVYKAILLVPNGVHKQDGVMTTEGCPVCSKRLMQNAIGNKWCFNMACDYHIRNGKQARIPRITVMAD